MRTRIKEFRKKDGTVSCYAVQNLEDDGVFRTIGGGMCDTKEEAEKVRENYKVIAKFLRKFNETYRVLHVIHRSSDIKKDKGNEEERD